MSNLKIDNSTIKRVKKTIQDANINFLIGSGMSNPYFGTLSDIEVRLSDKTLSDIAINTIKREYFETAMVGNIEILKNKTTPGIEEILLKYKDFYKIWNSILLKRKSSILTKQINVFTTNIDIFSEVALEETRLEFNDGFDGKFSQHFDIGNFKKSYFQKSLHYENTSEIPVFNLLKIHGSLTWKKNTEGNEEKIIFDRDLEMVQEAKRQVSLGDFATSYKKLMIVNPAKTKFEDTLLNQYYYDLLRIYSNELEKENSVLFVMGFSFADEHIRDMTLRVADSNPTLQVFIFSFGSVPRIDMLKLKDSSKNKNIEIIAPEGGDKYPFEKLNNDFFGKMLDYDEFSLTPTADNQIQ